VRDRHWKFIWCWRWSHLYPTSSIISRTFRLDWWKNQNKEKNRVFIEKNSWYWCKAQPLQEIAPADTNVVVVDNIQPSVEIPTPAPVGAPPGVISKPAQKRLSKPYSYPTLLSLPAKIAIPVNEHDRDFLNFSFLPCSQLSGNKKFNAFIAYCNHSENHGVLVSRAFPSTTITVQGAYLAIRQVCTFLCCQSTSTDDIFSAVPFLSALFVSLEFSGRLRL